MTLRRADDQLWRNSKSPSPCPVESFNKNCQVNQVHGKSKTYNKLFDNRLSTESLNRSELNNSKNNNEETSEVRNISVTVKNGSDEGIDLTPRTLEEKKKVRKPEKAIYIPKPISQSEKEGRIQQKKQKSSENNIKSEEETWDENSKSASNDQKKKRKAKGKGRIREKRDNDEKSYDQYCKEENPRRQYDNSSVQKQMTVEGGRFSREQKQDRRNYSHKRHEDKRRDNNKSAMRKSSDTLDYCGRSDSPEFVRNQQNFNVKTDKRDFRQNSEPRIISHTANIRPNFNNNNTNNNNITNNRLRDTRSMEHSNWNIDKIQTKPPVGRRGSGSVSISKQATFDSLPPRLKKKYMEEKGISMNLPSNSYIGTSSEEQWDGGSLSFLNNSSSNYSVQQYHIPPSEYQNYQNYNNPQQWPQKVPSPKGRGRGRLRQDEIEKELQLIEQNKIGQTNYRSPSRSPCATPFKNASQSHENIPHERPIPSFNSLPSRSFSSHDQVGPFENRYYDYNSQQNVRYTRDNRKPQDGRGNQWKEYKTLPKRNQYNRNSYSEKYQRTR